MMPEVCEELDVAFIRLVIHCFNDEITETLEASYQG